VNKNWSNDRKVGCKSPLYLEKLIEKDLTLEMFFENFEGSFE
jgi:hypothetical protein